MPFRDGEAGAERDARSRASFGRVARAGCLALANGLPSDRLSKGVRNGLYRLIGLHIGKGTSFAGATDLRYAAHPALTLGRNCFINMFCCFDLSAPIEIGDNVHIGTHCTFGASAEHAAMFEGRAGEPASPIRVGDGVWIATRVTVLPGVTIGDGAIVASGAVVDANVPANALAAGIPARVKRMLA